MAASNMLMLILAAASAQTAPPAISIAPVPQAPSAETSTQRGPGVLHWDVGEVACDNGQTFPGSTINVPIPKYFGRNVPTVPQVTFEFNLSPAGRPLSIERVPNTGSTFFIQDLPPAIAGSVFANVAERTRCRVEMTERRSTNTDVALDDLIRMRSFGEERRRVASLLQKFSSDNCRAKPSPRPLALAYPDFRDIPSPSGTRDWVVMTYDTDAEGRAADVAVLESSGNAALDAASVAAVSKSQWTEGAREGCIRYFWSGVGFVEAPETPDIETYGLQPEACDADDRWAREPRLSYPEAYRRRAIEGWAVLRYDVAPWGEIGNIEVLDAQPAKDLGRSAVSILNSAQFVEQETGLKGCVSRVLFKLPDNSAPAEESGESR